ETAVGDAPRRVRMHGHDRWTGRLALGPLRALRLLRRERHQVEREVRRDLGTRRGGGDQVHPPRLRRELPVGEQHLAGEAAPLRAVSLDLREREAGVLAEDALFPIARAAVENAVQ